MLLVNEHGTYKGVAKEQKIVALHQIQYSECVYQWLLLIQVDVVC
jgi:hypothetical protein